MRRCRAKLPQMEGNAMKVSPAFLSAFLVLGTGQIANAQSLSVNPSAAASEVRNPSSINPAAAASDIRNPSAINPAARGSQLGSSAISPNRPAGVAPSSPRPRIAPSARPSAVEKPISRAPPDKRDSKPPREATSDVPDADARSGEAAKVRHDEQYKKWDEAAKRAMGSICMGCGGETAPPPCSPSQALPSKRVIFGLCTSTSTRCPNAVCS